MPDSVTQGHGTRRLGDDGAIDSWMASVAVASVISRQVFVPLAMQRSTNTSVFSGWWALTERSAAW